MQVKRQPFCRQLAGLGQAACKGEWGVEPFKNNTRDITDFAKRSGQLPQQREGDEIDFRSILHRDGSVLSAPTLAVSPPSCDCLLFSLHQQLIPQPCS